MDNTYPHSRTRGRPRQARVFFKVEIEKRVAAHVRGVADGLLRANMRQPCEHVAVICPGELRPVIRRSLHSSLAAVAVEISTPTSRTPQPTRSPRPLLPSSSTWSATASAISPGRPEQALGSDGAAAVGVEQVLAAVLAGTCGGAAGGCPSRQRAWPCATAGRVSDIGGRCSFESGGPVEADAVEHAWRERRGSEHAS